MLVNMDVIIRLWHILQYEISEKHTGLDLCLYRYRFRLAKMIVLFIWRLVKYNEKVMSCGWGLQQSKLLAVAWIG